MFMTNENNYFMHDKLWNTQNVVLQELLTDLRIGAQLTQHQLSRHLNRPQSYVSKYESGERKLTLMEIRNIAICCGSNLVVFVANYEEELKLIEEE